MTVQMSRSPAPSLENAIRPFAPGVVAPAGAEDTATQPRVAMMTSNRRVSLDIAPSPDRRFGSQALQIMEPSTSPPNGQNSPREDFLSLRSAVGSTLASAPAMK